MGHWNQEEKSLKETGEDPDGGQEEQQRMGGLPREGGERFRKVGVVTLGL